MKDYNHYEGGSVIDCCGMSQEVIIKFDKWFARTLQTKYQTMPLSLIIEYFENKVIANPSLLRKLVIMNIIQTLNLDKKELIIDSYKTIIEEIENKSKV